MFGIKYPYWLTSKAEGRLRSRLMTLNEALDANIRLERIDSPRRWVRVSEPAGRLVQVDVKNPDTCVILAPYYDFRKGKTNDR